MAAPAEPISIAEIVKILEERKNNTPKIALILGSRAGALFRSNYFYEDLQFYSTRTLMAMKPWERFSECYNVLQKNELMSKSELVNVLKHALSEPDFSKADTSLIELIKQDVFKIIISSNIDDMLYAALVNSGMKDGRDFIDFSLSSHFIQEDFIEEVLRSGKPDACKIIRILDDAKGLVYNLNQPAVHKANGSFVARILERLRVKEVLVVGLDPQWDSALMSMLPPQNKTRTVWFINEDPMVMYQFLVNNHVEQCRYITGEDASYEEFLIALYWGMKKALPKQEDVLLDILNQLRIMQVQQNGDVLRDILNQLHAIQVQLTEVKGTLEKSERDTDKQ